MPGMDGYQAGANACLAQPFEKDDLLARLRILARYLEQQRLLKLWIELADARFQASPIAPKPPPVP